LAFSVAVLIERLSRGARPAPPSAPPARLQFRGETRGLDLREALRAVPRPSKRHEFIREDEYFVRCEALLKALE
jgi:hypothetical protein